MLQLPQPASVTAKNFAGNALHRGGAGTCLLLLLLLLLLLPAAFHASAAELEQLGTAFRVARTDLRWNLVQPAGPVDWGGYDRLLDSLQRVRRPTPPA